MIDWTRAIEAVPVHGGRVVHVSANRSFHRTGEGHSVDFAANPWCATGRSGGTYYVNEEGLITVGLSPDGYQALYYVRNVGTNAPVHPKVADARNKRADKLVRSALRRGLPDPIV